jgi:CRP/FNR family transcriptional regulator, cyclic AMP receptor protein
MIDPNLLLAKGAAYRKLATGEILFSEGDVCEYYFQITRGQLRWVNFNNEGDEYLQKILGEGSSIGEFSLFDGEGYAATAIANKPSQVLRLPKENFYQVLEDHPHIHFQFSKLLSQRLRFKFFLLKEIANNDSEQIITSLLSFLNYKKEHICASCGLIKLNRRQIGQMTGLRVETVIRVMRNLSEKGIIQIHKRKAYYGKSTTCINSRCHS